MGFFGTCPGISEYRFGYPLYPTHINKIIFAVKKMEKKFDTDGSNFYFFSQVFSCETILVEILLNAEYGY